MKRSALLLVVLLAGCFEYDETPARDAAADDLARPVNDLSADLLGGRSDGMSPADLAAVASSGPCLAQIDTGGCAYSLTGYTQSANGLDVEMPPGTRAGDVVLLMAWTDGPTSPSIPAPFEGQGTLVESNATSTGQTAAAWAYWSVSGTVSSVHVSFGAVANGGAIALGFHGVSAPMAGDPFGVTYKNVSEAFPNSGSPLDIVIASNQEVPAATYQWNAPTGWSTLAVGLGIVAFGFKETSGVEATSFGQLADEPAYPLAVRLTQLASQ